MKAKSTIYIENENSHGTERKNSHSNQYIAKQFL